MALVTILLIFALIIWIIYRVIHYETDEFDNNIEQAKYNKTLSDQYWEKVLGKTEHENKTNPYRTKEDTKTLEKISDQYLEKAIRHNNKNIAKTNNTSNEKNYDEYFKSEQDILNKRTDSISKPKSFYEQLLERPEWKKFRLQVLAEKGETCEWCQTNKNLQIHHKFYLKYPDGRHVMPWQYNINALLVLCKDCHTKAHKKYKIKSYYTSYYYLK